MPCKAHWCEDIFITFRKIFCRCKKKNTFNQRITILTKYVNIITTNAQQNTQHVNKQTKETNNSSTFNLFLSMQLATLQNSTHKHLRFSLSELSNQCCTIFYNANNLIIILFDLINPVNYLKKLVTMERTMPMTLTFRGCHWAKCRLSWGQTVSSRLNKVVTICIVHWRWRPVVLWERGYSLWHVFTVRFGSHLLQPVGRETSKINPGRTIRNI